jgi:hypothetical protein
MPPPYPIGLPSRNHDPRALKFCSTGINLRCIDFATRRQRPSEALGQINRESIARHRVTTGKPVLTSLAHGPKEC